MHLLRAQGFASARAFSPCASRARPRAPCRRAQCKAEGNKLLDKFCATSVPHFLFYRNGVLRDTVVGPNLPALDRALRALIPAPGEAPDNNAVRAHAGRGMPCGLRGG